MEDSYYIRWQEGVQGPFPKEHLLRYKNQKRVWEEMEVSTDKVDWTSLGDEKWLFPDTDEDAEDESDLEIVLPEGASDDDDSEDGLEEFEIEDETSEYRAETSEAEKNDSSEFLELDDEDDSSEQNEAFPEEDVTAIRNYDAAELKKIAEKRQESSDPMSPENIKTDKLKEEHEEDFGGDLVSFPCPGCGSIIPIDSETCPKCKMRLKQSKPKGPNFKKNTTGGTGGAKSERTGQSIQEKRAGRKVGKKAPLWQSVLFNLVGPLVVCGIIVGAGFFLKDHLDNPSGKDSPKAFIEHLARDAKQGKSVSDLHESYFENDEAREMMRPAWTLFYGNITKSDPKNGSEGGVLISIYGTKRGIEQEAVLKLVFVDGSLRIRSVEMKEEDPGEE